MQKMLMRLSVFVFTLSAVVAGAQPSDLFTGTWKINLTKSKYATPAPKSMTITFAPAERGWAVGLHVKL